VSWYKPDEQAMHAVACCERDAYVPVPQFVHVLIPVIDCALPDVQAMQLSRPVPVLYAPVWQFVQMVANVVDGWTNLPAVHRLHWELAPNEENWPPWQELQTVPPVIDWKEPARHAVHACWPELACWKPVPQAPHADWPVEDWKVPEVQERQIDEPAFWANVPARQLVHADELNWPVFSWNFPETQAVHTLAPDPLW
jgi:hypothetical protein